MNDDDAALWARAREGDGPAMVALFDRFEGRLAAAIAAALLHQMAPGTWSTRGRCD